MTQAALFSPETALTPELLTGPRPKVWMSGQELKKLIAHHKAMNIQLLLQNLIRFLAAKYEVSVTDLRSSCQGHHLVKIREVFTYIAITRHLVPALYVAHFLNRRHRMGSYYFKEIRLRMKQDAMLLHEVHEITEAWMLHHKEQLK